MLHTSVLSAVPLALAGTSFGLGARHGLDWDHVAAITDLTAPRTDDAGQRGAARPPRDGTRLLVLPRARPGAVRVRDGRAALGVGLPPGLDAVFGYVVGGTLVVLGAVVLYQLGRDRGDYRYAGRVGLLVGAVRRGWARARRREAPQALADVDRRGAFLVGLLHGTGAETPTQVFLFASAGATGSARHGGPGAAGVRRRAGAGRPRHRPGLAVRAARLAPQPPGPGRRSAG